MVPLCLQKLAIDKLKAKLLVVAQEFQLAEIADIRGDVGKADFGSQIRNYVLHPYKLVKDVRTGCETSNASDVLEGSGLDAFIQAYLRHTLAAEQANG